MGQPGGMPMPQVVEPAQVQREALGRSTNICASYAMLVKILERHEATIQKRWAKKKKTDRRKSNPLGMSQTDRMVAWKVYCLQTANGARSSALTPASVPWREFGLGHTVLTWDFSQDPARGMAQDGNISPSRFRCFSSRVSSSTPVWRHQIQGLLSLATYQPRGPTQNQELATAAQLPRSPSAICLRCCRWRGCAIWTGHRSSASGVLERICDDVKWCSC